MNMLMLVLLGLVMIPILASISFATDKKTGLKMGLGIFFICVIFVFTWFQYAFNNHFRIFVDLNFNPARQHMLNVGDESPLPLPPKTAFAFRGASNSCTYYTKKTAQEIVAYFKDIGEDFIEKPESTLTQYSFMYNGYTYRISINPAETGTGSYFRVETLLPA